MSSSDEAAAVGTPDKLPQQQKPKYVIPPLTKSTETPLSLRRRLDLRKNDDALTEKLNQLSLESSASANAAKTPAKTRPSVPTTPGTKSRPVAAAMPSPGLRRIRERLGKENSSSIIGGKRLSREDEEARAAAVKAVVEAEKSAAKAIDVIFAQQEGLLATMSMALKSGSGSNNAMEAAMLEKVAKAVEETTREQLAALTGVSRGGDEIKSTAVYWITMARFEESHDRIYAAKAYLKDGIEHMMKSPGSTNNNKSTTQIDALRLALERLEKRIATAATAAAEATGENEKVDAKVQKTNKPSSMPKLPPSLAAAEQLDQLSPPGPAGGRPRRRSVGKSKSPARKNKTKSPGTAAAAVTPTRRSSRIKARSAEKSK